MKIRAAQLYVHGVEKMRTLCLGIVFVMLSFALLGSGLILMHTGLFTFSMWSLKVKFILALVLGGIEFLTAAGFLFYLFREETWSRFSEIPSIVNSVVPNAKGKKELSKTGAAHEKECK